MTTKPDFADGLTQTDRKPVKGIPQPPKCPRYADDTVFYTYSKGPDISKLTLDWPYRGRGKGPSA